MNEISYVKLRLKSKLIDISFEGKGHRVTWITIFLAIVFLTISLI